MWDNVGYSGASLGEEQNASCLFATLAMLVGVPKGQVGA